MLRLYRRRQSAESAARTDEPIRPPIIELDTTDAVKTAANSQLSRWAFIRRGAALALAAATGAVVESRGVEAHQATEIEGAAREAHDLGYREGLGAGAEIGHKAGEQEATNRAYAAMQAAHSLGQTLTSRGEAPTTLLNSTVILRDKGADEHYPYPILLTRPVASDNPDAANRLIELDLVNQWIGYQQPDGNGGIRIQPMPIPPDAEIIMHAGDSVIGTPLILRPHAGGPGANPALAQSPLLESPNPAFPIIVPH